MAGSNIFYAQSGGVTAVINASACGVIETARSMPNMGKVFVGKNGILGALNEELIDTSREPRSGSKTCLLHILCRIARAAAACARERGPRRRGAVHSGGARARATRRAPAA